MARSSWKPIFIHPQITSQLSIENEAKEIVSFNRNTVLTEEFLNYSFFIYNGVRFFSIQVNEDMLGHNLGEFSPTKKRPIPKKKKK